MTNLDSILKNAINTLLAFDPCLQKLFAVSYDNSQPLQNHAELLSHILQVGEAPCFHAYAGPAKGG